MPMMLKVCVILASLLLVPALCFPPAFLQSLQPTPLRPDAQMFRLAAILPPPPSASGWTPRRHETKTKRTGVVSTPSSSPAESEVVWGACSPRQSWATRTQDAQLHCEAVISPGTRVTWYKGHQLLQRQGVGEGAGGVGTQEQVEEQTNMVGLQGTSSATHLLSSLVYLDCLNDHDSGDYSLEVRTVTNNVYFRNFTVHVTEMSQRGPSCHLGPRMMAFVPRVYQYSRQVGVVPGASVTLPCRAQGHQRALTWYLNNTPLDTTTSNYQVLESGDLIIARFNQQGTTLYECRVTSTLSSSLQDSIFTVVFPQGDTS